MLLLLLIISQLPWAGDITVNKPLYLTALQWQHLPKSAGGIGAKKIAESWSNACCQHFKPMTKKKKKNSKTELVQQEPKK